MDIFRPELALATLLAVIPVAIVFMLSQRALVRGLVGGGVKDDGPRPRRSRPAQLSQRKGASL